MIHPDTGTRWYHGSSLELTELRAGSTVTRNRHLAEIFSHGPTLVSAWDDGTIRHNGTRPGYLYRVAVPPGADSLVPHPRSLMADGEEFLTARNLPLQFIRAVPLVPEERLNDTDLAILCAIAARGAL